MRIRQVVILEGGPHHGLMTDCPLGVASIQLDNGDRIDTYSPDGRFEKTSRVVETEGVCLDGP